MRLPVFDNSQETHLEKNFSVKLYNNLILNSNEKILNKMCKNYLQVLEWNWNYYNGNVKMYNIVYKYSHGPLITDIVKYIPLLEENHTFIDEKLCIEDTKFHEMSLLFYVLPIEGYEKYIPKQFLYLIPIIRTQFLNNNDPLDYAKIEYFLCKYFWESKIDFEDYNITEINDFINLNLN